MLCLLRKITLAICLSLPILLQAIPEASAYMIHAYSIQSNISVLDWSPIIKKNISMGLTNDQAMEVASRLAQLYGPLLAPEAKEAGYSSITIYLDKKGNIGISFPC